MPRRVATVNAPIRQVDATRFERSEATAAVRQWELAGRAEVSAAPLHLVAGGSQRLDPRVGGHDASDLLAEVTVGRPAERVGMLGPHPGRHVGEEPPLAARLPDAAGDLGAEDDPPLRGGRGAAALLLVAGGDREQQHVVTRGEHLGGDDHVLVDAQGTRSRAAATDGGSGSTSRKLPPEVHSTSSSPRHCGSDHLRCRESRTIGHGEPPGGRQGFGMLRVDRGPSGERSGVRPHLGTSLHAGVAADRHEAGAVTTDVAAGEAEVDDGPHAVDRVAVLRDAHRPHEHGARRIRVDLDEGIELGRGDPRDLQQLGVGLAVQGRDEVVPAAGVGGDERLVDRARGASAA